MKEETLHSGKTNIWPMENPLLLSRAGFPSKAPPQSEPSAKAVPEPRERTEHMVLVPCTVRDQEHVILQRFNYFSTTLLQAV